MLSCCRAQQAGVVNGEWSNSVERREERSAEEVIQLAINRAWRRTETHRTEAEYSRTILGVGVGVGVGGVGVHSSASLGVGVELGVGSASSSRRRRSACSASSSPRCQADYSAG